MTRPGSPIRGALVAPNYLLTCSFRAVGPVAVLQDADSGRKVVIDAFNRAAFLYTVLQMTGSDPAGWVPCDRVAREIWGRKATSNNVNTLIYRIRRELKAADFSADFLEVRRSHVRLVQPAAVPEPDLGRQVDEVNHALTTLRQAQGGDRLAARERLALAMDRVVLEPELWLSRR